METDASSNVPTARWVALMMLLIALLSLAALFVSWRDFKYAEETRKTLSRNIESVQERYDTILISLRQQLRDTEARDRDLQGQLSVVSNRLQFAQDEVELTRRQTRQITQKSSLN